jgi:hypothetical protein
MPSQSKKGMEITAEVVWEFHFLRDVSVIECMFISFLILAPYGDIM